MAPEFIMKNRREFLTLLSALTQISVVDLSLLFQMNPAHASGVRPKKFIALYFPDGSELEGFRGQAGNGKWRFGSGSFLQTHLANHKNNIILPRNFDRPAYANRSDFPASGFEVSRGHWDGSCALSGHPSGGTAITVGNGGSNRLTGGLFPLFGTSPNNGKSVDQVIADQLSVSQNNPLHSLQVGYVKSSISMRSSISYRHKNAGGPIIPKNGNMQIFNHLTNNIPVEDTSEYDRLTRSINKISNDLSTLNANKTDVAATKAEYLRLATAKRSEANNFAVDQNAHQKALRAVNSKKSIYNIINKQIKGTQGVHSRVSPSHRDKFDQLSNQVLSKVSDIDSEATGLRNAHNTKLTQYNDLIAQANKYTQDAQNLNVNAIQTQIDSLRTQRDSLIVERNALPASAVNGTLYRPNFDALSSNSTSYKQNHANYMRHMKQLMKMTASALKTNITSVASIVLDTPEGGYVGNRSGHSSTHNGDVNTFRHYHTGYLELINSLLTELKNQQIFNDTVVFCFSEMSAPSGHKGQNLPLLLAGGGAGLNWNGRDINSGGSHKSMNVLLKDILGLYGINQNKFGINGTGSSGLI